MTQLIINGIELPWVSRDNYQAYKQPLSMSRRTIGGRLVTEHRGSHWVINYTYDYMGNALMREVLGALRSRGSLLVQFLPDEGDDLITGTFKCTKQPTPTVAWAKNNVPLWHNTSFTLEGIEAVND